jgi:hypothetical protein
MMRSLPLVALVAGLPGVALADCATVEDRFLDATSMRETADIRALKAELLGELDPTQRWLEAAEMYVTAAVNLAMTSPQNRDPQDAAVLLAAEEAMTCWNIPGDVPPEMVDAAMTQISDSLPPEKREELAEIARGMQP